MERFSSEDFSEFVYSWYLQKNKQAKLIDRCRMYSKTKNTQKLTKFLSEHPSLSWMQKVFDRKFDEASDILNKLAYDENEFVTRKKTMLSLAKLSKLVTVGTQSENEDIDKINSELQLIAYQEDLPDYVLEQYGYNTLRPRVIPTKELIHLYICDEYKDSTEIEFKKALDLLVFIKDEVDREELKVTIWKNAILRDTWEDSNLESPLEVLQNKLFFKLADLALILGKAS